MIPAETISLRVQSLAREIESEIAGCQNLLVVAILRGAFVFAADMVRALDLKVEVDFMELSSYGDSTQSRRRVEIVKDLHTDIAGRDVLVIEDIVDTGRTLTQVLELLGARGPARLRSVALLDKPARREMPTVADWTGFEVPDEFVVGYGIDYAQIGRNLPYIGTVLFTRS
ncbi:hypoxanthine phosphoribosyltransferase [Roseovarius salincola]|uniref:hypoxanthine phosphoribosyltransferase n=1 Tax=Roseovarius salincola TaxID=2978479 RepID=UPI003F7FE61F